MLPRLTFRHMSQKAQFPRAQAVGRRGAVAGSQDGGGRRKELIR